MMVEMTLQGIKKDILSGKKISKEEAMFLYEAPLEELCSMANEIREHFCGNGFDMCTIVNGKSGKCSEDCKYCAQSSWYKTQVEEYPLMEEKELIDLAKYNHDRGVVRYSVVTSGRRLSKKDVDAVCKSITNLRKEVDIQVCASFGLLEKEDFEKLKAVGVSRVHNNLETSRRNFINICTTHTYEDKIHAIRQAQEAGLKVCSGGIMGLGETMEDRVNMVIDIRELGIKSIPVNFLNPIPGTPYENVPMLSQEEMRRIVAVFRCLIPDAAIRLAGGRGLLKDKGRACFQSGANATISGDMLTTSGMTIEKDMAMIKELGFEVRAMEQ